MNEEDDEREANLLKKLAMVAISYAGECKKEEEKEGFMGRLERNRVKKGRKKEGSGKKGIDAYG